ncbi:MAG: RHS repeat-associated core domain-containing protein [Acidobacteriota bacterium]
MFTSKERDAETGLDFFGARYMSSAQGRFTTVGPVFATASLFNPQSWNGYAYTLNNPLKYVDTDGHMPFLAITAAVGAGIGGVVGAAREWRNQVRESGHVTSSGRIWTAAGGGALAGGLAGLTLGIGTGAVSYEVRDLILLVWFWNVCIFALCGGMVLWGWLVDRYGDPPKENGE